MLQVTNKSQVVEARSQFRKCDDVKMPNWSDTKPQNLPPSLGLGDPGLWVSGFGMVTPKIANGMPTYLFVFASVSALLLATNIGLTKAECRENVTRSALAFVWQVRKCQ